MMGEFTILGKIIYGSGIAMWVVIFFFIALIISQNGLGPLTNGHKVSGIDFHYNLTKQMQEETRLLDICINTDIKIPNCNMITAKINSSYGEAIK